VIGPTQRPLLDNTQHSQETDTYDHGEVRIRNPCNRAAADPHFRRRGHWDRWLRNLYSHKCSQLWTFGKKAFILLHWRWARMFLRRLGNCLRQTTVQTCLLFTHRYTHHTHNPHQQAQQPSQRQHHPRGQRKTSTHSHVTYVPSVSTQGQKSPIFTKLKILHQ